MFLQFVSRLLISPFKSWCFTFLNVHTLHCFYYLQYSNLNFVSTVIQPAMFHLYILNILNESTVDLCLFCKDLNFFRWDFYLYFPQALLVFLPLPKFFKPTNLSEVLTWYSSITFKSFGFLNLNVSISKFGASRLLTNSLSLPFGTTMTDSASGNFFIKYDSMSCPVSHDVIPLMVNIPIRFPTYLQMFQCGNTMLWAITFLRVTRFTAPTP